jgi:type III restriction enzyme
MKFKFKIQQYQTDAVENTVDVFQGQVKKDPFVYRRDLGKLRKGQTKDMFDSESGYRNQEVELDTTPDLTARKLLTNIQGIEVRNDIPKSEKLIKSDGLGACSLDIEMETGTGKTYVYIKTMFEMNKRYGWNKFIVVVPSIAIREGVLKSFDMLQDHFMELYGKKARYFVYDSAHLQKIDSFSSDAGLNVMIINVQAFNTSFKEKANNKEARIIYSKRDDFQSRRPIDVIAANRPIIIMDEPQKMEGKATQTALKNFKPLFVLNYSATHKTAHNCIYALDALDAYKKKLVKKIQVKGITLQGLKGTNAYIYFDNIILQRNHAPIVKLELEVKHETSIKREIHKFNLYDDLQDTSKLPVYEGYKITDIDPYTNTITFTNGVTMRKGELQGDVSEKTIQRVQIRQTIESHFEKEATLYRQGIKTLSLFFIDNVANYKAYDSDGNVVPGPLWTMFEEEYTKFLNENLDLFEDGYQKYLRRFTAKEVHNGYFSIDKKGHAIDSEIKRGETFSSDISAYDLILKNKERLLSFDEPTRFIFSHSALREGWDNPNVFQICTLRHASSSTAKRQEVGRGLRICVDKDGNRMDYERLGEAVHDINKLTVIANESYSDFVDGLQKETKEALRERPQKADAAYFEGRTILINGEKHVVTQQEATAIEAWLYNNEYIDEHYTLQQSYYDDLEKGELQPMGKKLEPMKDGVLHLIQGIFDPSAVDDMVEDGNGSANCINEKLNANADKKEFKALWNEINHKYVYTVHYDSNELIDHAIKAIDRDLKVTVLKYVVTTGDQGDDELDFTGNKTTQTRTMSDVSTSTVPYDLVGDIARGATLTRRTVVKILKGINPAKLKMFSNNPEEFIREIVKIIKAEKATMIVDHISYNQTENTYDTDIFTKEKHSGGIDKAYEGKKSILDYVFTDGSAENSIERQFAKDLDAAKEVAVYAKMPKSFYIPTPVGHYSPDWAIAFYDNMGIKHVFFIAETKGSMDSMQLRKVEEAKIKCAEHLYNVHPTGEVRYHKVTSYQDLLNVMSNID